MAAKPLTTEAIALTEKKMDMTLDDIIKMSKNHAVKNKKQRASNKSRKFFGGAQDKSLKVRQYMDSRSSVRQGVLAQRRSNFQNNRFPLASEAARRAAAGPLRNRAFYHGRAANWYKPRAGAPLRQQGSATTSAAMKPRQYQQQKDQQQQQQQPQTTKPKTLDSLFANMKEQRMRALARPNFAGRRAGVGDQRRQQWGRGRFGNLSN
ncbi:hypothetical protein Ancab_015469 [Ancistrocladus abbreviatus]